MNRARGGRPQQHPRRFPLSLRTSADGLTLRQSRLPDKAATLCSAPLGYVLFMPGRLTLSHTAELFEFRHTRQDWIFSSTTADDMPS